jgi:hypothetical protein
LDFTKKLIAISQSLETELSKIDKETNWSDYYFIPLEAEVEIYHNDKKERKITDLMQALKKNRTTSVFLLIGDPGSGKSVALRKLCKDIIKETQKTGRIPIYLNLKEWETSKIWTEQSPPTSADLEEFVLKSLKSKLDVFGNQFFEEYYSKLHLQGRIYYIIDSFDEIPSLLDVTESSWLIKQLSYTVYQFISGYGNRGILSSRLFRKPSKNFEAQVVLEIRSMSDFRIQENLIKSGAFNYSSIQRLYGQRIDLVHLASNPFLAALISNYVKKNNGKFPQNRTDLFNSYINSRLSDSQDKIDEKKLSRDIIILSSTKIAEMIFSKQLYGLEIPLETLKSEFKHSPYKVEDIVDILVYSKIGRIGSGEKKMFSFVHRRFNEYFVVQNLLQEKESVNLSSIPSDSRYRDALVLYCEVAPDEEAIQIVNFCWNFIYSTVNEDLQLTNSKHLEAVFCLRFLRDAFIQRKGCIEHIKYELSSFIFKQMESENFLVKKIALESSGLLNKNELEKTIISAFNSRNISIQETAFKEGKFLTEINKIIEKTLIRYLLNFSFFNFYFEKREIKFSLSLSPVFKNVYIACNLISLDQYLIILGLILLSLTGNPLLIFLVFIYVILFIATPDAVNRQIIPLSGESRKKNKEVNKRTSLLSKIFGSQATEPQSLEFKFSINSFLNIQIRAFFIFAYMIFQFNIYKLNNISILRLLHSTLIILLLTPFIQLYLSLKSIQVSKDMIKAFCKSIIPFVIIYASIIYLFSFLSTSKVMKYIFVAMACCFFGFFLFYFISTYIKSYINDNKTIKSITYFEAMDRDTIADIFNKLNFSHNRTRFVKQLESNVNNVSGHWPANTIPNVGNDYASLQLLKLDAIWLGLDN